METHEYQRMFEVEDHHWWYLGLRFLILYLLQRHGVDEKTQLLDAGCGTGGTLQAIWEKFHLQGCGFDYSEEALDFSRRRSLSRLLRASINHMPFRSNQFDVILSLDVLYHRGVQNDAAALQDFYRLLRSQGLLILHLPAYEWLKSTHDVAVHTAHRYVRREIRDKLAHAGFSQIYVSYRNSLLFPALALMRLVKRAQKSPPTETASDLSILPKTINRALLLVLQLENWLLRWIRFPFGLSLICIARKK